MSEIKHRKVTALPSSPEANTNYNLRIDDARTESYISSNSTPVTLRKVVDTNAIVKTGTILDLTNVWAGTQAQYDAIGTKSSTTIYFIV
jgi:hypothetical protein